MRPLDLARTEFALTIVFHYLLVALTLGLVVLVAIMHTRWARTNNPDYERMTRFWGLLYVVNYAVGIGAGLAMEFQLSMNWSGLENFASSVVGAPLAVETVVAFFAESTFLALWIFGWRRLPKKVHLATIWLVVVSAYMSAIWALVANGFMQNPVGYRRTPDAVRLTDVGALLTNPNAWIAIGHVVGGAVATGGFFLLGVGAVLKRRGTDLAFVRRSLRIGAHAAFWGSLGVVAMGVLQLLVVTKNQPLKFAAFIGDQRALEQFNRSLTQRFGPVDLPPSPVIRYSALGMMVIGGILLIIGGWSLVATRRDRILRSRVLLWLLPPVLVLPFLANIAGWVFREIGRQPFAIYEIFSVGQAMTPSATESGLIVSLVVFVVLIGALLVADWVLLARITRRGPGASDDLWSDTGTGDPPADEDERADVAVLV